MIVEGYKQNLGFREWVLYLKLKANMLNGNRIRYYNKINLILYVLCSYTKLCLHYKSVLELLL